MSGELFDEFDDLIVFGNPWHGYRESSTGTLKKDSGTSISGPVVDDFPGDGWNRFSDFGAPSIATSSDEATLGMTWLNKAIWTGFAKRVCAVHSPGGSGAFGVGSLSWPYRTADGTVWWLEAGVMTLGGTSLKVFARKMPMPDVVEFGVGATEVASLTIVAGSFDNARGWVNFAPDGSLAAIHCGSFHPWGDQYYVSAWECEIVSGSETVPPSVSLFVSPADFAVTNDITNEVLETGQVLGDITSMYSYLPNNPYPFEGPFVRLSVTGFIPGGNVISGPGGPMDGHRDTDKWTGAMAVVYTVLGERRVLYRRSIHVDEESTTCLSASGYVDGSTSANCSIGSTGTYGDKGNAASVSFRIRSLVYAAEQILLDSAVIAEVVIQHTENDATVGYVGTGSAGAGTETMTQNVLRNDYYFSGVARDYFLANGDTALIVATDEPRAIIAYGNSRSGGQYPESGLPAMPSLNAFSTHPITGVFDPGKDRYF